VEHQQPKTVTIVGSGMGALSAAALLARKGLKVIIFEQNYLPGGCTSSYWRKGFVFESGATTLVGLDEYMPLKHLLDQTGIQLNARKLNLPMQVHLMNGEIINRYQGLEQWITEAERVFGKDGQRAFWTYCYRISQFVWKTSLQQRRFPPKNMDDLLFAARNLSIEQLRYAPLALFSTEWMLRKFNLDKNHLFMNFVNEQLLISAQNHAHEVNALFGAAALCYTNYGNYYLDGGLINLVNPVLDYIQEIGGELHLRTRVESIQKHENGYLLKTDKGQFEADFLISGIPINNLLEMYPSIKPKFKGKLMQSKELYSAFQMGIGFKSDKIFESIHHQIHLLNPLPHLDSDSIFISLNHEKDNTRTDEKGLRVMSVSTHIRNPENADLDKKAIEGAIIKELEIRGFLLEKDIVYKHSSSQKAWEKWTGRAFGFVGGYPQYFHIKPWQMNEARLDGHKAYLCGDTAYPGQGIPGTVLSGIIAYEKLMADWD